MNADLVIRGGNILDVEGGRVHSADLAVQDGIIRELVPTGGKPSLGIGRETIELSADGLFLAPGYIDAHIHLESSFLPPEEFVRCTLPRGTTAVFADPHEVANVCGRRGVDFFLDEARRLPQDLFIGAPSCVPATPFEENGANLPLQDIAALLRDPHVYGLAEMMNFPGIIRGDGEARAKVDLAFEAGRLVDGHCPALTGADLQTYVSNGRHDGVVRISSDHEVLSAPEAREKIRAGMMIALRHGSLSRELERLLPKLSGNRSNLDRLMLCSDDVDAAELVRHGHVDRMLRRTALILRTAGFTREDAALTALRLGTLNPSRHFAPFLRATGRPPRGNVAAGFQADLVALRSLDDFTPAWVVKSGRKVAAFGELLDPPPPRNGQSLRDTVRLGPAPLGPDAFRIRGPAGTERAVARVIHVVPESLLTREGAAVLPVQDGFISLPPDDVLVLAVVERHRGTNHVGLGLVRGLGLRQGVIASSVTHDSHNLIVAGRDPEQMAAAVHRLAAFGGGMLAMDADGCVELPLPLAGLMSDRPAAETAAMSRRLLKKTRALGSPLSNPFMTLSFLALPVIPDLKLTTRGLFDVRSFQPVPLFP